LAFVVIQHLDPARPSALPSLLSKATSLPVLEISNRIAVQPNHVYVIPPNKRASIRDGTLSLEQVENRERRPIDDFMTTLAKVRGESAVGVVLSGTGSDGTRGLAAIKASDGFTFAQDPKTASWPAMPLSAIDAGFVDFVLPPARIALALGHLGHSSRKPPWRGDAAGEFDKIFGILRTVTGIDFHDYKRSTILRRILRQMTLHGVASPAEYARLLSRDRKEAESLADQVFVPFTGFLRDPESFHALQRRIRLKLRSKRRANSWRVWVAGCSSGEEVYSIAMLLVEELGLIANRTAVQVFGTDIRETALRHARVGLYPKAALAQMSPARRKRFFVKSEDGYRICPALRDLCVFALHDLTKHPPFSNLDLISCRNVLPYLKPAFQNQALTAFHFALKPRALLFTDSSIAAKAPSHFTLKDRKHGILSRMPDEHEARGSTRSIALRGRKGHGIRIAPVSGKSVTRAALLATNEQLSAAYEELETANEELQASIQEIGALSAELRTRNTALTALANDLGTLLAGVDIPVLVLDSRLRIIRFTAAAATLFHLESSDESLPFMRSASNLGELPWQELLSKVTRGGQVVERTFQHRNGRWYSLRMKPFGEKKDAISGVLILLLDEDTVHRALQETHDALTESESTVRTLLDASPQAILAVDASGTIVWANNTTAAMFGYDVPQLLRKPLDILVPEPYRRRHAEYHRTFLAAGKSRPMGIGLELQGRRKDGALFPVEIGLGWVSTRKGPRGVAFVTDITERRRLHQSLRQREQEVAVLFDNSPDALVRYGPDIRATHVNAAFENATGIASKDIVGRPIQELPLPAESDVEAVESLVRSVFTTGLPQTAFSLYPTFQGMREFELRYIPEFAADRSIAAVFSIARDVTEQKRLQDLAAANARDIRALSARLITSQEQERRRLARDIHDSLCQHLGILAAEIGNVAAGLPKSNPTGERLRAARKHALSIADEARQVASQLHPSILEDLGLPKALRSLCDEFRRREGIRVNLRVRGLPLPVPIDAAACAYRVTQEAVNNIAKHARAKNVVILLTGGRGLDLSIRDDGIGFDPGAVQGAGGLGLVSMRERARLAGGELSVDSKLGQGTCVRLVLRLAGRAL